MESFCGNSQHVKAVGCFCRRAPLMMFEGILSQEKIFTTGVTQGNLKLHLPPISPYSHQTQIQLFVILD